MSQNTTPNGSSNELKDPYGSYDVVKPREPEHTQPIYNPQQIDGSPRPQFIRSDSRTTLPPRPTFQNPLARPPQPRPPLPPGAQFAPRPPLPQQRFPVQLPNQPLNQFPPRPPLPTNGAPPRPPVNLIPPNAGVRPPNLFPRPQGLPVRPQGLFQQRSLPANPQRPPFNSYPQQFRSQTLDPSEVNLQNANSHADPMLPEHKSEAEKPNLAAMKNRSFSVNAPVPEPTTEYNEDRRRSVSSVGSLDENKPTDVHMKKIDEGEDRAVTPNRVNFARPPSQMSSSRENLAERIVTSSSPLPNPTPTLASSPLPPKLDIDTNKSVRNTIVEKEEKVDVTPRRATPELKPTKLSLFKSEGDNDSGVDESTQGNDHLSNGDHASSKKSTRSSTPRSTTTPTKNKSFTRTGRSPSLKSPGTPTFSDPGSGEKKKIPMNKIQVGSAPSPNLKVVKSKIGSLQNAAYKPGGGNVKIESRKIDFSAASSRIAAKNDSYQPGGGDKKIQQKKLEWNASSKIGSLENTNHKPKGSQKKIESVKLDFKDKAKSKVGSKDNMKHVPGGGDVKIESKKLDIKVESKVGSLGNLKHKPGGGDKKIFDDKDYIRQMSAQSNVSLDGSQKKKFRPNKLEFNSPEVNIISPTQHRVRIMEEVQIMQYSLMDTSRPSSRMSRSGSFKMNRPDTPRPRWRY